MSGNPVVVLFEIQCLLCVVASMQSGGMLVNNTRPSSGIPDSGILAFVVGQSALAGI